MLSQDRVIFKFTDEVEAEVAITNAHFWAAGRKGNIFVLPAGYVLGNPVRHNGYVGFRLNEGGDFFDASKIRDQLFY